MRFSKNQILGFALKVVAAGLIDRLNG